MSATARTATSAIHAAAPRESAMRAIVHDRYGDASVLRLDSVERPTIADEEVLVAVHAAGLDRGTWHLMTGKPYAVRLATGLRGPRNRVPGRDVSGTVVAVGGEVTRFAVGDEVFGISHGSFAEFAAAHQDKLARRPAGLTSPEAATLAISGITALRALTNVGGLTAGQRVLVIGASGGVGTFAVQIAKSMGAEVTGVSSAAKAGLVRSLGADHVIDYRAGDFADGSRRYDLVLDIGGSSPLSRLRRLLTRQGTLVMVGGEGGGKVTGMGRQLRAIALSPFVGQKLRMLAPKEHRDDLGRLADLVDAGALVPSVGATYTLDRAPEAMEFLAAGQAAGKIAITVASH